MPTDHALRAAGVALSVVLLAAACSNDGSDAASTPAEPAASAAPTSAATAPTSTSAAKTPTKSAKPKNPPTATATPAVPTPTPTPTPTNSSSSGADSSTSSSGTQSPVPDGAEMAPTEDGVSSPTPTGLPGLTPVRAASPLVGLPLPSDATAEGRLVAGFPSFLRPPAGSSIATSGVSTDQDRLQVVLVGTTALSPEQVLRAYRKQLTSRGLDEQSTPSVPGAVAAAFVRGGSSVSVTMTIEGTRTTYSVYGTLQAGKA